MKVTFGIDRYSDFVPVGTLDMQVIPAVGSYIKLHMNVGYESGYVDQITYELTESEQEVKILLSPTR